MWKPWLVERCREVQEHPDGFLDLWSLAIFLILLLGLGGIAAKLFSIQIQHGRRLAERATRQYIRLVPLVSRRGIIFDRAGRELAVSLRVSSVFAEPGAISPTGPGGRTP